MQPGEDPPENLDNLVDMFNIYPHESAIVMRRGIEIGVAFSIVLVSHQLYILYTHFAYILSRATSSELLLFYLSIGRLIMVIPRPYLWQRARRRFIQARCF